MKNRNNPLLKRVLAVSLSVAVAVSFLPILGDAFAYADDQNGQEAYYVLPENADESGFVAEDDAVTKAEINAEIKEQAQADGLAKTNGVIEVEEEAGEEASSEDAEVPEAEEGLSECGITESIGGTPDTVIPFGESDEGVLETKGAEYSLSSAENFDGGMAVLVDEEGTATVYAEVHEPGVTFTDVYVDEDYIGDVTGQTEVYGTFDTKAFPVGYHTVSINLSGGEFDGKCLYYAYVPTNIYDKPLLRLSDFYTGISYFNYYDNYNEYYYDSDCKVYLDYKKGNGGWATGYGPVAYGESKQRSGLAAASTYSVHTYFGKSTEYTPPKASSETHFFKGPATGNVSFKTAYKATPVKSIKAKKVKQWCKKIKVRKLSKKVYWMNGYAGYGPYRKILGTKIYKYWYTKVKITVTMTKVPGIAGVYIGSKKVGGNKKTYAATFVLSGKKKGKKIAVSVYSYMSPTYVGLSGKTLKKVKVK